MISHSQIHIILKPIIFFITYSYIGSYWIANTFIWSWLLRPILPLGGDLIQQDFGSNMNTERMTIPIWKRLCPYFLLNLIWLIFWAISYPGWFWFISKVLKADQPILVKQIICHLIPFYVLFTFGSIINGIFYGMGRTDILALKSFIGNCIIAILFTLFTNGILFSTNVFSIATIFGVGLVSGFVLSSFFLMITIRKLPITEENPLTHF